MIETLYGFDHYIKGDEPFLHWWRAGLYLKFNKDRQSHVLVETYANSVNLDELRKGDTFRVRIERITTLEVTWKDKLKQVWKKVLK